MRLVAAFNLFASVLGAPCDIFAEGGTPCVAAHSMVRALFDSYNGSLYTLKRGLDNATTEIGVLGAGGFADSAAHDAFCAGARGGVGGLPPFGSIVSLEPVALPGYRFRHCDSQGFVTPFDWVLDHSFTLEAALSGLPGAVSFRSVNFPASLIAPISGAEPGRVGIVQAPEAADASWTVTPAANGGVTLTSVSRPGLALAIGGNLTGSCASSYKAPCASVYLTSQPSAWTVAPTEPAPVPVGECVVWELRDQTGNGNDMVIAGPAINNPEYDKPVNASRLPLLVGGHKVYGAYFEGGFVGDKSAGVRVFGPPLPTNDPHALACKPKRMGYRAMNTTGVARDNDPETIYMVTSGQHVNSGCCFDYGNSENAAYNPSSFCDGCMEAIYFGTGGGWCGGGNGPHVLADLENGLWGCATPGGSNPNNTALDFEFVTALVKGFSNGFGLKGGDATDGGLKLLYQGPRPPGYQPMHKTGGIILGVGGDNVAHGENIPGSSIGTFLEGALTAGATSDDVDNKLQADIVSVGFGRASKKN